MATINAQDSRKSSLIWLVAIIALAKVCLHLYSNLFSHYGLFRDEFYYLACAEHPDYGYVDQPPFSIWLLMAITSVFGKSLFAIRLLPAILSGASIFMIGLTTIQLGGKKVAVSIVCLSLLVSGIHLAYSTYYSMNVIDLFLWSVALFLVVKVIKNQKPIDWLFLGFVLGIASLNKIAALFFGVGLLLALLLTPMRKMLFTRWPYITGVISLGLFSIYAIWNMNHDMAHLEFIHNASTGKYSGLNAWTFWSGQILLNNPITVPIWIGGVVYFFTNRDNIAYRFLFIIFVTVAAIFTINGTSKSEYLASIFPVLLMGGSLQFENLSFRFSWVRPATLAVLLFGLALAPFALPLLPVKQYITYAQKTGISPENSEGKKLSELPQFYADMFGWEDKVAAIAKVYHSLPPEDQVKCAIYGDNYGRCGSVDYYSEKYDLPKSIGKHNNYWLWGPRNYTGELMIIISNDVGDKRELFESVEDMGVVTSEYGMPYENNLHIYVCRDLRVSLADVWPKLKSYN